jgi:hypothetical protein
MRIQRRVEVNDLDAIESFLNEDLLINRYLDFYSLAHWIGQPGFVLDQTDGKLTGVLLNVSLIPDVSWIRLFASIRFNYAEIWERLLNRSLLEIGKNKKRKVAS